MLPASIGVGCPLLKLVEHLVKAFPYTPRPFRVRMRSPSIANGSLCALHVNTMSAHMSIAICMILMSTEAPIVIEHANLSVAWSCALLETMKPGKRNLRPLVVTIGGFSGQRPAEDNSVRDALDQQLVASGKISVMSRR